MGKKSVAFVCTECGAEFSKWQGQCTSCKEWNTLSEVSISSHVAERGVSGKTNSGYAGGSISGLKKLNEIDAVNYMRYESDIPEFDKILSGGIVKGATHMISGEPGAGKSTLLLQYAASIAKNHTVLYAAGEESLEQISLRANRLKIDKNNPNLNLVAETNIEKIISLAKQCDAKLLIVDSIQTGYIESVPSAPGSSTQLRESTSALNRFCKANNVSLFLVGHYTKDGSIAGPKILEHIVDGMFVIEGEQNSKFRIIRPTKYRFGNLETAFFAMGETGLKSVSNPSKIFLQRLPEQASGSLVTILWEGTRPILVELQALVQETHAGHASRLTVGLDRNRVNMVLAIIQKKLGLFFNDQDVFLNIVGGLRDLDTTSDLPIALTTLSSFQNFALNRELICFGEVGLVGEVRAVSNGLERIREAEKLGFKYAIVPKANVVNNIEKFKSIKLIPVETISQAYNALEEFSLRESMINK